VAEAVYLNLSKKFSAEWSAVLPSMADLESSASAAVEIPAAVVVAAGW
jgi:hypothetical protein